MQFLKSLGVVLLMVVGVVIGTICWQMLPWSKHLLVSPVDSHETKTLIAENVWVPKLFSGFNLSQIDGPKITAKAAFFVETRTGKSLYEKNINEKLPIASLTKIMTAIVTLERRDWNDRFYVSPTAAAMEPDKMQLKSGEWLTVEELMKGLFLVSANDAAEVFAEELLGNRNEFIHLMNTKAQQLGMNNTLFVNPTGLQEDGMAQYATAVDVAMMAKYLIGKWGHVVDITSQSHIEIPATADHQDYDLYSGINLLTTYPGVVGLKTGYTPEAGLTLVTLARRDGVEVLGVILGSENRREEARELLDYSFTKLGKETQK